VSRSPGLRFDKREPCASCPYRTDAPLGLWSPEEFEGLLRSERDHMGTLYGCHEFNKRRDEAQVCIGWLLNQRERDIPSIALRMKLMTSPEARACTEEASSPVSLYESVEEMCEANGVEW
jgi:hypothetical protein